MHDDKGNLLSITDFTERFELYEPVSDLVCQDPPHRPNRYRIVANLLSPINL